MKNETTPSMEIFCQGLTNNIIKGWTCKKHKVLVADGKLCPMCKSDEALEKHRQEIKEKKMFVGRTSLERRRYVIARDNEQTKKKNMEKRLTVEGNKKYLEQQKKQRERKRKLRADRGIGY